METEISLEPKISPELKRDYFNLTTLHDPQSDKSHMLKAVCTKDGDDCITRFSSSGHYLLIENGLIENIYSAYNEIGCEDCTRNK